MNYNNPVVQVGESPIAEAFLGNHAAAFATIETTPSIIEYNSPMKGQEQQTNQIVSQQGQEVQMKKGKLTKKQKQLKMIARNENLDLKIAREKKMAMKIARQQMKAKKQAAKINAT